MEIIKIDLDLKTYIDSLILIKERLQFLIKIGILKKCYIKSITLIKKNNYSCKIEYDYKFNEPLNLILIQAMLGDDYKRTAITLRDYHLKIRNYNRLFDVYKKYFNNKIIPVKKYDITKEVFEI